MHRFLTILGNLLVLTGLLVGASVFVATGTGGGFAPVAALTEAPHAAQLAAAAVSATPPVSPTPPAAQRPPVGPTPPVGPPPPVAPTPAAANPTPDAHLPITRLVIPSIDLDTDVVAAPLVDDNGAQTWQVPAFKAGHLEDTADAGERGNAVLMGHVSSLHSGDVFKDLDRVQVGNDVEVFTAEHRFVYRVSEMRSVPRTDVAMVEPTAEPVISLFTCTGLWDPFAWDFTERLFVRATLVDVTVVPSQVISRQD